METWKVIPSKIMGYPVYLADRRNVSDVEFLLAR